jgi:hypothetical protein
LSSLLSNGRYGGLKIIRSNFPLTFVNRFEFIALIFLDLNNLIDSGLMSVAKTDFAFEFNAVSAWIPEPEPISRTVLFFEYSEIVRHNHLAQNINKTSRFARFYFRIFRNYFFEIFDLMKPC